MMFFFFNIYLVTRSQQINQHIGEHLVAQVSPACFYKDRFNDSFRWGFKSTDWNSRNTKTIQDIDYTTTIDPNDYADAEGEQRRLASDEASHYTRRVLFTSTPAGRGIPTA